ncbi:flavin reductase family protein [Fusobacterium gastrosuis]|uniref:flavin reductase family protein n=1 Tax=Fusobacterium gastrosuis TaxID=1755100 RepID=UPI0029707B02|nr:flavin reductase family protein [Fusobacteriaceae bacterium]MDY5713775.1 flavin reductase family protein [Fusobacterium gastrosuis]
MEKKNFKGSVVLNPVPVVLVTCKNLEGKENVFTVAWTGTICSRPPMLSISIRPERLSYDYIKQTKEFIINLPTVKQTKATDYCGVKSGRTNDKIKEMGFTMIKGDNVECSYIAECPVNIECRVKDIISLGSHDMFIADVLSSHINDDLIDDKNKIHFEWADLIAYSHGEYFPIPRTAIGKFGYSVAKKINKNKKSKK